MSKKIKKYMLKRELKRLLMALKKNWIWLMVMIGPGVILLVLHHITRRVNRNIRKAVKAKVRERIADKMHDTEDFEKDDEQ